MEKVILFLGLVFILMSFSTRKKRFIPFVSADVDEMTWGFTPGNEKGFYK